MAIEGVTQTSSSQPIGGYRFRDVAILGPLVIPSDDSGVEVQLRLQPANDVSSKGSTWTSFSLFACPYDNFVEICRGDVKAVDSIHIQLETDTYQSDYFDGLWAQSNASEAAGTNGPELYCKLEQCGYGYGPYFQGIETARRDGVGQAVGLVSMRRPSLPPACAFWTPAVIHPCLLDVMLQLSLPVVVSGNHVRGEAWIPTHISKLSLSRYGFESDDGECHVQVRASTRPRGTRSCEASIQVCDTAGKSGFLRAEGVELTMVADDQPNQQSKQQKVKRLCYDMILKPDVSLMNVKSLSQYISDYETAAEHANFFTPLQRFVDIKAHKNPGMRVLELGTGVGITTKQILETLTIQMTNGPLCRFACYDYTNASQSVLETMSAELGVLPRLEFRLFDPQHDHGQQGFKDHTYDLVIAENVRIFVLFFRISNGACEYLLEIPRFGMGVNRCRPAYQTSVSC